MFLKTNYLAYLSLALDDFIKNKINGAPSDVNTRSDVQHISHIKARLFWLVEKVFYPIKMQQTSAATCKLMQPH